MTRRDAAGVTRTPLSLPPFPALFLSLYHSFRLSVPLRPSLFLSPSQLPLSLYSSRSFSPLSLSLPLSPSRSLLVRPSPSPSLPLALTPSLLSLFPSFRLLLFPLPTHPSLPLSSFFTRNPFLLSSNRDSLRSQSRQRARRFVLLVEHKIQREYSPQRLLHPLSLSLSSLPVDSSFAEDMTKPRERFRGKRFALPIFKHVKPIDREINDRLIVATRLVRASWERRGRRVFRNRSHFFFLPIAKRFPRFFCAVQGNISRRSLLGKQIAPGGPSSSSSSIPD